MSEIRKLAKKILHVVLPPPLLKSVDLVSHPQSVENFKTWGFFSKKLSGRPHILTAAGHGFGNVGDEAQCGACISRWRSASPDARITLFSPNPAYTQALHKETAIWAPRVAWFRSNTSGPYDGLSRRFLFHYWFLRTRLFATIFFLRRTIPLGFLLPREASILQALLEADLFHISGGGFLTGKTRSRLWENCLLMEVCQRIGLPYVLTGHNIGVFQNEADRKVAKRGLKGARYIGLRDRGISEKELAEIGIKGPHVQSTCDDALLCDKLPPSEIQDLLRSAGVDPAKPWVAVNFHHWGQNPADSPAIEDRFAEITDWIVKEKGMQTVFIAMTPTDIEPTQNVVAKISNGAIFYPYSPDYRVARGIIAGAELVFTMKHHPIVFAQGEGVPVVSVALESYYLHKNRGALENTGHANYVVTPEEFSTSSCFEKITSALDNADRIREEMLQWTNKMREEELSVYRKFLLELECTK